MQLVHLATKKRPDKMRLAADPIDLLKPTPSGKARWQVILTTHLTRQGLLNSLDEAVVSRLCGLCYEVSLEGKDGRLG